MKPSTVILLALLAGCARPPQPAAAPPLRTVSASIPVAIRQTNYGPSCTHASAITMLRWQGREQAAAWWRRNGYGPARVVSTIRAKCKQLGIACRAETGGKLAFLEWVSRTRRAAVLQYQDRHAVTFCGFRGGNAIIIDNRWPHTEVRVPKQQFIESWRAYGGHAITIVDLPPPPQPWR